MPTKRKQSPFSILHNGMKLGRKIILKRVLEELEPQGRCHQRQWFPFPGRNQEGLAEGVSKRDLAGRMASALTVTRSLPGTFLARQEWPCRCGQAEVATRNLLLMGTSGTFCKRKLQEGLESGGRDVSVPLPRCPAPALTTTLFFPFPGRGEASRRAGMPMVRRSHRHPARRPRPGPSRSSS